MAKFARHHVFFRGSLPCNVLFIGEAPGKTEDATGLPFVGLAGRLLEHWITMAMPSDLRWAITNTVACRPTCGMGQPNRQPLPEEIGRCSKRLEKFIEIAQPEAIITLGKVAAESLTTELPFLRLLHPAFVLRQGGVSSSQSEQQIQLLRNFVGDYLNGEVEHKVS